MKKILCIAILCIVFLLSCGFSAPPMYYDGNDLDLFTEATHSVISIIEKNYKEKPQIKVLEEDKYGRKLFIYSIAISDAHNDYCALLVSQKADEDYVYYYPNYNFIIAKIDFDEELIENFNSKDVEKLKAFNDWNKEINNSKCIRKAIISKKLQSTGCTGKVIGAKKEEPELTESMKNNFQSIFYDYAILQNYKGEDIDFLYRSSSYCTSDVNGKMLYYAQGLGRDLYGEEIGPDSTYMKFELIIIFNADGSYNKQICAMPFSNKINYQEDLKTLKDLNGWKDM